MTLAALPLVAMQLAHAATPIYYEANHTWKRSSDWANRVAHPELSIRNPDFDIKGARVWNYEYTQGGDKLGSSNPWYLQPKSLMIWDANWNPPGPTPEQLWARADNAEPKINQYNLSHSRSQSWNAWDYNSLVRWINPAGDGTIVKITGTLNVDWGGWGVSPDVPVDVIVGLKDASTDTFTVLYSTTVNNPTPNTPNPPYPRVPITLNIPDFQVDTGDSIVVSMRAQSAPSVDDSWILMYDDMRIQYVRSVPALTLNKTSGMDVCSGTLNVNSTTYPEKVEISCTGDLTLTNGTLDTNKDLVIKTTGNFSLGGTGNIKARRLSIQTGTTNTPGQATFAAGATIASDEVPAVRASTSVQAGAMISIDGAASEPITPVTSSSGATLLQPQSTAPSTPTPTTPTTGPAKLSGGALDAAALTALGMLAGGLWLTRRRRGSAAR